MGVPINPINPRPASRESTNTMNTMNKMSSPTSQSQKSPKAGGSLLSPTGTSTGTGGASPSHSQSHKASNPKPKTPTNLNMPISPNMKSPKAGGGLLSPTAAPSLSHSQTPKIIKTKTIKTPGGGVHGYARESTFEST